MFLENQGFLKSITYTSALYLCGNNEYILIVGGDITKDGSIKNKVDPCGVCSLRVMANSVLCVQCGKWINCRSAGVKRAIPKFSRHFTCEGNIGEAVEHKEKLCDEVETVKEFTCLGDRVSAGGGCESVVTARTRCGWVKFKECGWLLYGRRFPQKLIAAVIGVM